jgi:hypothetical protein
LPPFAAEYVRMHLRSREEKGETITGESFLFRSNFLPDSPIDISSYERIVAKAVNESGILSESQKRQASRCRRTRCGRTSATGCSTRG